MTNTLQEFDEIIATCKDLFIKKMHDYSTSWRVLRPSSVTDQISIKAQRIRNIEEAGNQLVSDNIESEFIGIVNYAVMAQIQLEKKAASMQEYKMNASDVIALYDKYTQKAKQLLSNKNHDYNEAWRDMRISSITDIIIVKLLRIKQIEDNNEKCLVSEGLDANYYDIFNYAIFALIKLKEEKHDLQ